MFKTTFDKKESRNLTYPNHRHFQWETFEKDLTNSLRICNGEYNNYEENFIKMLKTHASKIVKMLRGSYKPRYNKNLRQPIINRQRLKSKANRSKDPVGIANLNKQRDCVVLLSSQVKSKSSRHYWGTCKPCFWNKQTRGNPNIRLTEKGKMLLKMKKYPKNFYQYFGHITRTYDSLGLNEYPYEKVCEGLDDIDNIVCKFRNHLSIIKIKEQYKVRGSFSFRLATTE